MTEGVFAEVAVAVFTVALFNNDDDTLEVDLFLSALLVSKLANLAFR